MLITTISVGRLTDALTRFVLERALESYILLKKSFASPNFYQIL